jgi:SEC-C motif domain protein
MDCPCRMRDTKPLAYDACCQPWHAGIFTGVHAPTPEALMRSRYSAYALAKQNNAQGHAMLRYLHETWHSSTAPDLEISPIKWVGVDVLDTQYSEDVGIVEFKAYFKVDGKSQVMHELSRFVRIEGAWKYIDGDVSPES